MKNTPPPPTDGKFIISGLSKSGAFLYRKTYNIFPLSFSLYQALCLVKLTFSEAGASCSIPLPI